MTKKHFGLLVLFLLVLLVSSCKPKQELIKYIVKDSVVYKVNTTYRDTIVNYTLNPDTVFKKETIYIKNNKVIFKPVCLENDFSKACASVRDNKINLVLIQKDTTLKIKLEKAIKERDYWIEKYNSKESTIKVEEKKVPFIFKLFSLIGFIFVLYLLWILKTKLV